MPPLAVLLGLEDGLHLRVAGGPVHLLLVVPSFARESAASLSGSLRWDGIHCRVTAWPLQCEARAADRSLSSVSLFDWRAYRTDKASVRRTTLGEA